MPVTVAAAATAYKVGKSFLGKAKNLFKRKGRTGSGEIYRYVDHQIGWFATATGQWFGSQSNVIGYLKTKGKNVSNQADALVYLAPEKRFSGYSLVDGHLFDRNLINYGQFVGSENERLGLARGGLYSGLPATRIPPNPNISTARPGSPVTTSPTTTAQKSAIPVLGLIGLAYTLLRK